MEAPRLSGLAPIFPDHMTTVVLGSLPGNRSLRDAQYYAHPRNAFWPIMAHCFGWPSTLSYQERLDRLGAQGIGLWDVIEQAHRSGSLDSAIASTGLQANPLAQLITERPALTRLCFNGNMAYQVFHRSVLPNIDPLRWASIQVHQLPSTSPAHAAMAFDQKATLWQKALGAMPRSVLPNTADLG
jgi:TDG/mug DNA glycosylase family protein